ncbi:MAG: DNA replication/repair protein RecF [Bacilli bacterium]
MIFLKIYELKLVNFRNYSKLSIKFNNNVNIIIGKNAQGKTNILESIYMLAITKSHRLIKETNIIKEGQKKFIIEGHIKKGQINKTLKLTYQEKLKEIFINKTKINKISDYIGNFNIIMFTPDDLEIVKGSPNVRRNLLNIEISQINKNYLKIYNEYNKILKTRNEYLKILYTNSLSDKRYLDILTDKLIERAIIIYKNRYEFIDKINSNITTIYNEITNFTDLKINYITNIEIFNKKDFNDETIKRNLLDKFKKNYKKELTYGTTLYGPHRDDFLFNFKGNDLKIYGSQGQQRLAIIAFKLSEIPIFLEATGYKPILLLDDIFSEIDKIKKNKLIKFINNDMQVIITTTDLVNINKKLLVGANIYKIDEGKIIIKGEINNGKK